MDIKEILTAEDEQLLLEKVTKEYQMADNHTSNWKNKVENVWPDYLFPEPEQDKVKVRKIWNNLKIIKSIFLADELQIINVPVSGQLWKDISKNADKVLKANFESMDIRWKYEEVLVDDALQGVWVLAVDWWNDHDQEPIVSYIDSRLTFPDPKNWKGNEMRFFGTLLRKSIYELDSDKAYDKERVEQIRLQRSAELDKIDRSNNKIKWFTDTDVWDDLVDVYNHITVFKSSKDEEYNLYLTSWGADRTTLIRAVRMRPLTKTEQADPSKITLWISLFRSKPIKWSYAWATLEDEIGQYQDLETLFTNLSISQAIEAGMWGKTFLDDDLGIDPDDLANIEWPAVIPYKSINPSKNAANSIILEQPRPNNPAVQNGLSLIQSLSQEASSTSNQLVQWQSQWGSQTKAEFQWLQQNLNQNLKSMQSNYMKALKRLWSDVMRSYSINMSPQRKKEIVNVDEKGNGYSYWFKKNEFVSNWEAYIVVKSKAEQEAKNEKQYAQTLSFYGSIIQLIDPKSEQAKDLARYLMEKSNAWIDPLDIIPYWPDKRQALEDLDRLNNNEKASKPVPWQDHNVFINVYKTGEQTRARDIAIANREIMIETEKTTRPEQPQEQKGGGWVAQQLWASMIAQDNASGLSPSISDIAA